MNTTQFLQRCHDLVAESGGSPQQSSPSPEISEAESLIGFFQMFRPDGDNLGGLFNPFDFGDELADRLLRVFEFAGNDRRPEGGRDAYFIVRSPRPIPVEQAEHHATTWISEMQNLAGVVGDDRTAEVLASEPKIRVLEGIPPKHPKQPHERTELLQVLLDRCPKMTEQVDDVDPHAELLRPAYYFMACDAMLRDYLMWPFYRSATGINDPFRSYFVLWSHGVKFRTFREDQIDLYLPRH